ncbi:DUF4380 domain-containing protein [Arcticibacter tournemirensis]
MMKELYKGWEVYSLQNEWIRLLIAPQLGGRIMQLDFKGYEFFFVNPALEGETSNACGCEWMNYGGEKIWPAPQGWESPECWPGPPDPVLDGGNYTASALAGSAISLVSPPDDFTGLQIHRDILIDPSEPQVSIDVRFENKSDVLRRWAVWPVVQMKAEEDDCHVIVPLSLHSSFQEGYKVMHGLVNNPQNRVDGNRLIVTYQYVIGKVGADTKDGWVAFCDKTSGKVFVMSFDYEEGECYPDNTSVQVWTQGRGTIYSRNVIKDAINDKVLNPPYLEIELLSPLKDIAPLSSIRFTYHMRTCTIPVGETVVRILGTAIIAAPLKLTVKGGRLMISGKYGFFCSGTVIVRYENYDIPEDKNSVCKKIWPVSPMQGIEIETYFPCNARRSQHPVGKAYIEFENKMNKSVQLIESMEL